MTPLPKDFIKKIQDLFVNEAPLILDAIKQGKQQYTFRINNKKISEEQIKQMIPDDSLKKLSLSHSIYSTQNKTLYTKNPLIFTGAYYFQDLASMIPTIVMDIQDKDTILDVCASPGSKSTHILSYLGESGKLIMNEATKIRVGRLIENVSRWGANNVIISNQSTESFSLLPQFFDKVLIDAPCSGEGMFYKNTGSREEWSAKLVKKCAKLQKQICDNVLPSLKVGGELIYSTCTLSVEENEEIINYLLDKYQGYLELVDFSSLWNEGSSSFKEYNGQVFHKEISLYTKRILPYQENFEGEAFFIAKLKVVKVIPFNQTSIKPKIVYKDYWNIPKQIVQNYIDITTLSSFIKRDHIFALGYHIYYQNIWSKQELKQIFSILHPVYAGVRLGILKKDRIQPSIESVTSLGNLFCKEDFLDLTDHQIQKYLLGEEQPISNHRDSDFKIISYKYLPLGFGKIFNGILKSYFKVSQGKKIISHKKGEQS